MRPKRPVGSGKEVFPGPYFFVSNLSVGIYFGYATLECAIKSDNYNKFK